MTEPKTQAAHSGTCPSDCSAPAITDAVLDIVERWLTTWCKGSFARMEGLGPENLLRHREFGLAAFEQEQNAGSHRQEEGNNE
jgi:hypothetical protein